MNRINAPQPLAFKKCYVVAPLLAPQDTGCKVRLSVNLQWAGSLFKSLISRLMLLL